MKAGLYNKLCTIMRKRVITGDYRDKEVWEPLRTTKVNFQWTAGDRKVDSTELFFSHSATITLRSYIDIQDEDHVMIDDVEYRVITINRDKSTQYNQITAKIDAVNK